MRDIGRPNALPIPKPEAYIEWRDWARALTSELEKRFGFPDIIQSSRFAPGSVATASIADGSITNAKLAANSVDSSNIINGAVTNVDLAASSVGSGQLINGSVSLVKIVNNDVTKVRYATAPGQIELGVTSGNKTFMTMSFAAGAPSDGSISYAVHWWLSSNCTKSSIFLDVDSAIARSYIQLAARGGLSSGDRALYSGCMYLDSFAGATASHSIGISLRSLEAAGTFTAFAGDLIVVEYKR